MQENKDPEGHQLLGPDERVIFWRHMAFRLFLGAWALYSVICEPLHKALIALLVLACFKGMGETVFASLMAYARLKAQKDAECARLEEIRKVKEARAQALAQAQAASAAQYFEFGKQGNSAKIAG
jgi:hypothetical protein